MARLPTPGGDENTWGTVLNDYLSQAHNADGTLKPDAVQSAAPDASSTTQGIIKLTNDLGGTADAPLVTGLQDRPISSTAPTNNQVLVYNSGAGQWEPQTGGAYTDEQAQDAVGTILTDSSSVDFTYDDNTPLITAAVLPAGIDKNNLGGSALSVANGGTGATSLTSGNVLVGAGTSAVSVSKAAPTGNFVGTTDSQTLTNKTITDTTNNVTANGLRSATTTVSVSGATAPTANQILRATGGSAATWQDLSAANVSYSNSTSAYTATTVQAAIDENAGLLMQTGTLASRPAAATAGNRALYYATDDSGGTLYRSNGSSWQQIGASVNQTGGTQLGSATLAADYTNSGQGAETQLTGMSVTVTVGSRPIAVFIDGLIVVDGTGTDTDSAGVIMKRDSSTVNGFAVPPITRTASTTKLFTCCWHQIDAPSAGSHTYTLHFAAGTAAKFWTAKAGIAGFFPPFRFSIVEL